MQSKAHVAKRIAVFVANWKKPKIRARRILALKRASKNPKRRDAIRRAMRKAWKDPVRRKCWVQSMKNRKRQGLGLDHDHKTGRIRGMLCNRHNLALGHFRDEIKALQAAVRYLKYYDVHPGPLWKTRSKDLKTKLQRGQLGRCKLC